MSSAEDLGLDTYGINIGDQVVDPKGAEKARLVPFPNTTNLFV